MSNNEQKLLREKISDYQSITKFILVFLGLVIIALLLPVLAGLTDNIGQLATGQDVVDTAFEQQPYLKYFFMTIIFLVVMQGLVVITFLIKVDSLNKQLI